MSQSCVPHNGRQLEALRAAVLHSESAGKGGRSFPAGCSHLQLSSGLVAAVRLRMMPRCSAGFPPATPPSLMHTLRVVQFPQRLPASSTVHCTASASLGVRPLIVAKQSVREFVSGWMGTDGCRTLQRSPARGCGQHGCDPQCCCQILAGPGRAQTLQAAQPWP